MPPVKGFLREKTKNKANLVLQFIKDFVKKNSTVPSYSDIVEYLTEATNKKHTISSVRHYISILEKQGLVEFRPHRRPCYKVK